MFLYFLFPFLITLLNKNSKVAISIGTGLALVTTINVALNQTDSYYSNPIFRVPDFLIGIGFYFLLNSNYKSVLSSKWTHLASIIILTTCVAFLGSSKYQYMLGQVLIAPLFGIWIYSTFDSKNIFYNNRIMIYLGKISYSFYIWQFLAIEFAKRLKTDEGISISFVVLLCFILNIAIASLSYYLIEEPLRKKIVYFLAGNNLNIK